MNNIHSLNLHSQITSSSSDLTNPAVTTVVAGNGEAMDPSAIATLTPQTPQLIYPTTDFQPFMNGEFPSSFDITNLFDLVLPDYMGL